MGYPDNYGHMRILCTFGKNINSMAAAETVTNSPHVIQTVTNSPHVTEKGMEERKSVSVAGYLITHCEP